MSRGESEPKTSRSRGVAIGISFALLCLAALTLVVRTTNLIEDFRSPWAYVPPQEPVVGVFTALRGVPGFCANLRLGPTMPGPAPSVAPGREVSTWLLEQGMVELTESRGTLSLPGRLTPEQLQGGCGYVLAVPGPGTTFRDLSTMGTREGLLGMQAYCGTGPLRLDGAGDAEVRIYTLPGVNGEAPSRTGLSPQLLLRMALAEAALVPRGMIPSTHYLVEEVAPGPPNTYHTLSPPALPSHGCIAWVAIAEGFINATSNFEGQSLGNSCSAWNGNASGFSLGLLSCASTSTTTGASELVFNDASGAGGRVIFRPFGIAPAGPRTVGTLPVTTVGALREAEGTTIALPSPVARREP